MLYNYSKYDKGVLFAKQYDALVPNLAKYRSRKISFDNRQVIVKLNGRLGSSAAGACQISER